MHRSRPWWTLLLPLSLGLAIVVWTLTRPPQVPQDENTHLAQLTAETGFVLEPLLVHPSTLVSTGMPRDGLTALDHPAFVPASSVEQLNAAQRGKFLVSSDRVIGVEVAGDARAYPLRIIRWHEVINDTVGGLDIAVTYSPLCDAVVVVERRLKGDLLEFGVSGLLFNSNLVLYDRHSDPRQSSLWSQLSARAIAGPAAASSQQLRLVPCELSSWESWRARHPSGRVLGADARFAHMYKRDPYHSYFGSELLRFPVDPLPPPTGLELKDRVVALELGGEKIVLSLRQLAEACEQPAGHWEGALAGHPLSVEFSQDLGTAVITTTTARPGNMTIRYAYWFAWFSAYPNSAAPGPST